MCWAAVAELCKILHLHLKRKSRLHTIFYSRFIMHVTVANVASEYVLLRRVERVLGTAGRALRSLRAFSRRSTIKAWRERFWSWHRVWSGERSIKELLTGRLWRSLARVLVTWLETGDVWSDECARHFVFRRLWQCWTFLIEHVNHIIRNVSNIMEIFLGSVDTKTSLRSTSCRTKREWTKLHQTHSVYETWKLKNWQIKREREQLIDTHSRWSTSLPTIWAHHSPHRTSYWSILEQPPNHLLDWLQLSLMALRFVSTCPCRNDAAHSLTSLFDLWKCSSAPMLLVCLAGANK